MEAVEFAGHQGLDNLILIYDSNDVTLDAMADKTQSENTALRFKAMNWDVQTLADGHDLAAILKAVNLSRGARKTYPWRRRHLAFGSSFADALNPGSLAGCGCPLATKERPPTRSGRRGRGRPHLTQPSQTPRSVDNCFAAATWRC